MNPRHRFRAPVGALLMTVLLAACGTQPSSQTASDPPATPDIAGRDAYRAAMCPVFDEIVVTIDPRLAALRAVGAREGPSPIDADEIAAVIDALGTQLDALEEMPAWDPGRALTFSLITAAHSIRAHLLNIDLDGNERTAFEALAAIPFFASQAMDLAMADAVAGGLACEGDG
jgi:hypothetical protein